MKRRDLNTCIMQVMLFIEGVLGYVFFLKMQQFSSALSCCLNASTKTIQFRAFIAIFSVRPTKSVSMTNLY
ncbi:hypothetical protein EDC96DRAFT_498248 [Choanephora cucurbitarum]|nr:hypothetical protein EDC96DRAFT_498248 [Choanephora cucurbitarum]